MRVDAFQYVLPAELIAQHPADRRELARLLVLGPEGSVGTRLIGDLPEAIDPDSLVVVNDTRVVPARLIGRKHKSGGRVELLLLRRVGKAVLDVGGKKRSVELWRALGKASKPLKFGADIDIPRRDDVSGEAHLFARLLGSSEDDGLLEVALWANAGESVSAALRACGHIPLPPYVKRADSAADVASYQTVYARHDGAVAAPTAGLHLTHALLGCLAARGCELASVTLHVGLGTFQPVTVADLDQHRMHAEDWAITESAAEAIARARRRKAPVVAIGTTTMRALESAADPDREGFVRAGHGETRLLIQPGYAFRVVDALLTNFHLPRSTLLALVCAFGGTEQVLGAYEEAVRQRFRFFSYGDAMFLRRRP